MKKVIHFWHRRTYTTSCNKKLSDFKTEPATTIDTTKITCKKCLKYWGMVSK